MIAANDGVVELETDKAVVEIPCPHAGRVAKLLVKKGDTVKVGQAILTIASGETAEPAATDCRRRGNGQGCRRGRQTSNQPRPAARQPVRPAVLDRPGPIPAGPAVRRLAREQGVDLRTVAGSGKYGRITPEDLQAASSGLSAASTSAPARGAGRAAAAASAPVSPPSDSPSPAPVASGLQPTVPPGESGADAWGPVRVEKLSRIRRTIAEQMTRSAATIPHVTNFDDADVTELERLRQGVPAGQLSQNIKLTMMPFVMKAVAMVLRRHPAAERRFRRAERADHLQGIREPGHRRRYAPRPRRAERPQRRPADDPATGPGLGVDCRAGPGFAVRHRRPSRRHVHDQQSRRGGRRRTARRSSIIRKWPFCCWAGRAGCRWSAARTTTASKTG